MNFEEKWKIMDYVGEGGQGMVYKVIRLDQYSTTKSDVIHAIRGLTGIAYQEMRDEAYEKLFMALPELIQMHSAAGQDALKVLHQPQDARDADLAEVRIKREINAMSENLHPNLIRILEVDPDYTWYVSEFYPNQTLADHRDMFKGDFLKSLKGIRPLVEGVATLHKNSYVHRDIKPKNIFSNSKNELILGDFGLIHFIDTQHTRISEKYENVGSRDWMPAWAMGIRLEDVRPSFDVFSLGKVLWSMVSGKQILRLWYFDRDEFNVEQFFPEAPFIKFANPFFEKCIVEEEKDCIQDAGELLKEIDDIILSISSNTDYKPKSTTDNELQFEKRYGIYISKEDGLRYCTKCYHSSPKNKIPLQEDDAGWRCNLCGSYYSNPNYNPPEQDYNPYVL